MSKQTQFHVFVDGGALTAPSVTALTNTATNVAVPTAASTSILAADATRRYVEVFNPTASTIWINFGVAAGVNTGIPIAPGQSWYADVQNNFQMCQQEIRCFQNSGAGITVPVLSGA